MTLDRKKENARERERRASDPEYRERQNDYAREYARKRKADDPEWAEQRREYARDYGANPKHRERKNALRRERREGDPMYMKNAVQRFINEQCIVTTGARIRALELFDAYNEWAAKGLALDPESRSAFGRWVTDALGGRVTRRRHRTGPSGELEQYYWGVRLRSGAEDEDGF